MNLEVPDSRTGLAKSGLLFTIPLDTKKYLLLLLLLPILWLFGTLSAILFFVTCSCSTLEATPVLIA